MTRTKSKTLEVGEIGRLVACPTYVTREDVGRVVTVRAHSSNRHKGGLSLRVDDGDPAIDNLETNGASMSAWVPARAVEPLGEDPKDYAKQAERMRAEAERLIAQARGLEAAHARLQQAPEIEAEGQRGTMARWLADGTTWIGVFECKALDSVMLGHRVAMAFDDGQYDAIKLGDRAPDTVRMSGWSYLLIGKARSVVDAEALLANGAPLETP